MSHISPISSFPLFSHLYSARDVAGVWFIPVGLIWTCLLHRCEGIYYYFLKLPLSWVWRNQRQSLWIFYGLKAQGGAKILNGLGGIILIPASSTHYFFKQTIQGLFQHNWWDSGNHQFVFASSNYKMTFLGVATGDFEWLWDIYLIIILIATILQSSCISGNVQDALCVLSLLILMPTLGSRL